MGPGAMASALREGASGVFVRGGRKVPTMDGDRIRDLPARIGEPAVASSFPEGMLRPRGGTGGAG